ncbi:MAG: helicase [Gammaproteobacteria bacterium]|nr:helicase [Gammaproteobacteria bacterium]
MVPMLDLEDIFGHGGPLASSQPDFKVRWQQLRMAQRVATALEHRETLIVEAGTGTGKTFAYLVPALLSGARVLISTGTRTLQDQLFSKDLPLVAAALGRPARVALLKGRTNYLCRYRIAQAGAPGGEQLALDSTVADDSASPRGMLARIERWARTTRSGDLAEVRGLSDSNPVWPQVTSTRDNCLGVKCPELSSCHVALARREALDADIVIVNHHLLLADLALKEDGFGDILGTADAVILDEAHQIPDLATQFFGANVSSRRIENLVKAAQAELTPHLARVSADSEAAAAAAEISEATRGVEQSAQRLSSLLPARLGRFPLTEMGSHLSASVNDLAQSLQTLQDRLGALGDESPLAQLSERAADLVLALERIASVDDMEGVRAVEISPRGFALSLMPFDISARFLALLQARRCGWIFTSATLSLGEDFSHFTARLGLVESPTLKIESPFDYERQSLLYLPTGMPQPASPGYTGAVIDTAVPLIDAARGGAFILFTSHRALAQGAALLRARWANESPYRLFVQGEAPRERLLTEFREDGNGVLLGTTSFWEGVDVKGEALRLVIIEKLPFSSPEDPLVRARIDHLQATGGNAFRDYQLPEAALALKQGVGRLIRSEDDFGTVVICDPRMTGRGYGQFFLAALPAMAPTRDRDEALRFIRKHAPHDVVPARLATQL